MKNNDFDFIKNRFDSVEPSMPDSLNKEILRQKISSNEEHKTIKFEQKKNYFKPIISAAACFILIAGIAFAANSDVFNTEKISGFGNYDEVNSKITELEKESSVSEGGCGIFNTTLVKDEENVEKPDVVKTDGEYIYCAYFDVEGYTNRNKVYIYKIQDNESEFVSVIDKLASDTDGEYSDFYKINTLFVYNNRLVIILDKSNPMSADKYKRDFNTTIIKIYDISDKSNPSLITEIEQSGEYNQARMISGILYLTSDYNVETNDKNYTIPWIKQNEETTYASSKNIVCFENAKTAQYAVISTIDVETGELSKGLKAVLGGSAKIYCTKDYMCINEYIEGERYGEPERDVTSAMKLNFKNGKFTYRQGHGRIPRHEQSRPRCARPRLRQVKNGKNSRLPVLEACCFLISGWRCGKRPPPRTMPRRKRQWLRPACRACCQAPAAWPPVPPHTARTAP